MRREAEVEVRRVALWPAWCCPACSAPLRAAEHGLVCDAEGRWLATDRGVHRLLAEERRRELLPYLELYQRVRRDEGWRAEPGLPEVAAGHPQAALWQRRALHFRRGVALAEAALPDAPWDVLEVGAGCCWASAQLLRLGHRVAAVDVNLDPEDGLPAAEKLLPAGAELPRAEADMEALPLDAGLFDLVLAAGSLHHPARLTRVLVELRRVTRRCGALLVLDSPVYRRRADGEAMVEARTRDLARRFGVTLPRESQSTYLALLELPALFRAAGWRLSVHGWPGRAREWARDLVELARHGRRTARFPVLLARRDG